MASQPLFTAKDLPGGLTQYISRKTGIDYTFMPDDGGIFIRSTSLKLQLFAEKLCDAMRAIETIDLANLPKGA